MRISLMLTGLALGAGLGFATTGPAAAQNVRTRTVVVFGTDECPKSTNPDEVIVCARRPEEERYRIPKTIRDEEKVNREDNVAEKRAALAEGRSGKTGIGSCSTAGAGGSMGCTKGLDIIKGSRTVVTGIKKATEPTEDGADSSGK
jgi:hypothetical protein